jgi:hypothetical protein
VKGAPAAAAFMLCRLAVVDDFWIHQHRA